MQNAKKMKIMWTSVNTIYQPGGTALDMTVVITVVITILTHVWQLYIHCAVYAPGTTNPERAEPALIFSI